MEMETVKLSRIVEKHAPELYPFLKKKELNSMIVLRDGADVLKREDVAEIVQMSIYEHQKNQLLQ